MSLLRLIHSYELLLSKWSNNSPLFALKSSQIEILYEPNQFFNALKDLSLKSKSRITISSLYIGTGKMENELVSCFKQSQQNNSDLKMTILLDHNRGTRVNERAESSKSFLLELVKMGASVSFFLTPNMSGLRRYLVFPRQKWNELVSLHHIKCYIFDDHMIISGANLNEQYFTNRQDRYILFKDCKLMCDYFDSLVNTISMFSLHLNSNGDLQLHSTQSYHPLDYWQKSRFCSDANQRIKEFKEKFYDKNKEQLSECDTIALPLLQFKPLGIDDDETFTANLLANAPSSSVIQLASGYFNLTKKYKNILLKRKSKNSCRILMASERANGFFGSKGVTGQIPFVYTYLTRIFLNQSKSMNSNILLNSYNRPEWTFHGKGLWLWWNSSLFLTMIGSPNFGYRSVYRDNETQIVLITCDEDLKQRFHNECEHLWKHSNVITDSKQMPHVPFWVSLIAKFFKSYF